MMHSRKLSMQLTPLLDLLLIVIFAQFMDFRQKEATIGPAAAITSQKIENLERQLQEVQAKFSQVERVADVSDMRIARAESNAERYQRELATTKADLDRTLAQHRVLGELVVELFNVPQADVAQILNPNNHPTGLSEAELGDLKDKFRKLAVKQSGEMIGHLLSYEEIRKRCDVWNLHVNDKDLATLDTGDNVFRVRVPFNVEKNVDKPRLLSEFYSLYRSLPQPKSLVIILLTYDRGTSRGVTQPFREILPQLVAQMQSDRAGGIRFEYADLGFRIE